MYFLDDQVAVLPNMIDKNSNYNRLKRFKEILKKNHTCQTFYNVSDLKHKILSDLSRTLNYDCEIMDKINFKDMELTPDVYNHQEYDIDFTINNSFFNEKVIQTLDAQIIENLDLARGNTIFVNIDIINNDSCIEKTALICQNRYATWLKNIIRSNKYGKIHEETSEIEIYVFHARVKYVFTIYKELDFDENDYFYKPEKFTGFVLLETPKVVRTYYEKILKEIPF